MADTLMLDSIALRALAEYAQSVRAPGGDPVYFVATPSADGGCRIEHQKERSEVTGPQAVVTPASTPTVRPGRPKMESVDVKAAGMAHHESMMKYDALFWSEAAVEKFLFPYYASKYQWLAAHVLAVLSRLFYGHVPTSAATTETTEVPTGTAGTTGASAAFAELDAEEVPFAVGHIPRSDYGIVDEAGTGPETAAASFLGRELAVLFRAPDGTVRHRLLAEFL